jgi:hypothetical protein
MEIVWFDMASRSRLRGASMCNLLIRNVRLGEGGPLTDSVIRAGRMATIEPAFPCDAVQNIDGDGAFCSTSK